ncbi:hypothetical protein KAFR_0F00490 [Kazachstania africana CBS 2517]|uniref:Uncharacterized protein n=1 Tax=Kazachstania africana (strain ATCC 22294 / BCRC 22015 / CBS 2517 / CECT 1963 / NBRC 1671 / NRRL Y-8276) TaxID=1071382 RepID=H2AW96_KAZAF|nr:hypothetical protein KAFR_0F00490 [Kazachstania africana CBS 2517]CCF58646.1 hypothetical protein KAFR_0F00490 [Kazachstania africana CBS 2517]
MTSSTRTDSAHAKIIPKPTFGSLFINTCCLLITSWGLKWATTIILPPSLSKAGHKQFLTNISVIVTMANNVINILNWFIQRFSQSVELSHRFDFISRHLTLPIALVLESIVPVVYWPLRLFALKLIMQNVPEHISPIPIPVDISIHLVPIVFLLGDHYLSGSGLKFKISNFKAWLLVTLLGAAYYKYLQVLIDPSRGQVYPYPFLDVNEPYRSVIFVIVSSVGWGFYTLYQNFPPKALKPYISSKKEY